MSSTATVPHTPAKVPLPGLVFSALLSAIALIVLLVCMARRLGGLRGQDLTRVPLVRWVLFAIYFDSLIFIIATTTLTWGYGLNKNLEICATAIYLCLACYMSTKILIYYFLVEKVHIVRSVKKSRLSSKLYAFNCFGMLVPYVAIVVLNFIYKIAYFDKSGTCIVGMKLKVLMPLIIFDACINFFLTILFIIPLRNLYSYKKADSRLKTVALRSFIGSCCTLASSIVNLTVLMVLHGEASWICLMCCNADTIFSVLMLHWVTSKDSETNSSRDPNSRDQNEASTYRSRLGKFTRGGGKVEGNPEWEWRMGGTTTKIECGNKDGSDIELQEDDKGGINVRVGHSVVVETDMGSHIQPPPSPRSTSTMPKSDYEEGAQIGNGLGRSEGHVSQEDLVKKDIKFML